MSDGTPSQPSSASTSREPDALVVGSGPNGLSAAIALAREGLSVQVFEASETIGGGARSSRDLDGCVRDVCSTAYPAARLSPWFRELDLEAHGVTWVTPPVAVAHPLDGGRAALLEVGTERRLESLGEDADAWERLHGPFTARAAELFAEMGPLHFPRRAALMAQFAWKGLRAATSLARSAFRGELARALFAGCAAHSFLPLEQAGSAAFGLLHVAMAQGAGWPFARGGSQAISDALAAILRSLGGTIVTGRRVDSLAELPRARAILLDLAPEHVARIAGDRLPASYRGKLERFRRAPAAFKVDFALDGPIPWAARECERAGVVHVGGTLEEIAESERAAARPAPGAAPSPRPFVLVAQPTLFDDTRAPSGRHVAWAYCHVPNGCTVDMTDPIAAQIERFAPGFRDRVRARIVTDPAALARSNANLVGGDISGGANDLFHLFARPVARLVPYATPDPSLFLCSSSTPPGGGVHGMSGWFAARVALARVFGRKLPFLPSRA